MEEIETKTLYDWAWKHWGSDAQIDVLIEEMAELTQALLKSRRNGVVFSFSVIEEIADVEICMEQIRQKIAEIGSQVPLETIKRKKLIRLRNRLIAGHLAARIEVDGSLVIEPVSVRNNGIPLQSEAFHDLLFPQLFLCGSGRDSFFDFLNDAHLQFPHIHILIGSL